MGCQKLSKVFDTSFSPSLLMGSSAVCYLSKLLTEGNLMSLDISIQREAIRLFLMKHSNRYIADYLRISPTSVARLKKRIESSGYTKEDFLKLNDTEFISALKSPSSNKSTYKRDQPDWTYVQRELTNKKLTLMQLWLEYIANTNSHNKEKMSYSHYARLFRRHIKSQRISMRQLHAPGEKMFVDFCGQTVPIYLMEDEKIHKAQIFVAVLGNSSFTFAYAVMSQSTEDWIKCHEEAFQFYGGVPKQVVSDNLKAAILKHTSKEIIVNQQFEELSEHYNFLINPARVRKPKDKSLVEVAVKIIQNSILAALRNHKFFDINDLNKMILTHLQELNRKKSKAYPASRQSLFETMEKQALSPLPKELYGFTKWIYGIKIPDDYHIEYLGSFYSVPYTFRFSTVDMRISSDGIEFLKNRQRIAYHVKIQPGQKNTIFEHMPLAHQQYSESDSTSLLEWAKKVGPNTFKWAEIQIKNKRSFAQGVKNTLQLKKWVQQNSYLPRLESACEFVLKNNITAWKFLRNVIKNNAVAQFEIEPTAWVAEHENLRGADYYQQGDEDDTTNN